LINSAIMKRHARLIYMAVDGDVVDDSAVLPGMAMWPL
jgi:hypothetical protein